MSVLRLGKTHQYIGRAPQKEVLNRIAKHVDADRTCLVLYIEAEGGLGKTRILEYCPTIVAEICPNIHAPDIIDLYDYANRNTTWIERQLVEGLREEYPGQPYRIPGDEVQQFFKRYYVTYERYTNDQSTSSSYALTQIFIRCWNSLAAHYPLLIRFDTVEKLFTGSAPPDALVSGDQGMTSASLLLDWLRTVLSKGMLQHTFVLFSGRPITDNPLIALLRDLGVMAEDVQVLQPLEEPAEIREYMGLSDQLIDDEHIRHIQYVTEGRPLLLTCYTEWLQQRLPLTREPGSRLEFEDLLLETILNPLAQPDAASRTLAYCLYVLAYARRGIWRRDLRAIFDRLELECDDSVIDQLDTLALIKTVRVAQKAKPHTDTNLLFLHDEIYQLIDESGRPEALGLRDRTLSYLCEKSRELVARTEGRGSTLLQVMSNHMYYELTRDIVDGYRIYTDYIDYLLNIRQERDAIILADVFWSMIASQTGHDGQKIYPYLDRLNEASAVSYAMIMRDEQVRRVKLLRVRDQLGQALDLAEKLFEQFIRDGVIPAEQEPDKGATTYPNPYLFVDLGIAWATATVQVTWQDNDRLECFFERLIALLKTPEVQNDRLRKRALLFLSEVYGLRGYLRERQQWFEEAITCIGEGRDAFKAYRASDQRSETLPRSWYTFRLAHMINTQASTYAHIGELDRALKLSNRVIANYTQGASNYYRALFYNTNALINIGCNDYDQALQAITHARKAAELSDVPRANGLVKWTAALIERRHMNKYEEPNRDIAEMFEQAIHLLRHEPATLVGVYDDFARFARDIAWLYRARGDIALAAHYDDLALKQLYLASECLPTTPSMQRADLLETMVSVYNSKGDYAQAAALLAQIELIMDGSMPKYRHVLCGKLALQRALLAHHASRYQEALRLQTIGLSRAIIFASNHHDRAAFELIITQLLRATPRDELDQFRFAIQNEQIYVTAHELPYQRPSSAEWAEAWDMSLQFISDTLIQIE